MTPNEKPREVLPELDIGALRGFVGYWLRRAQLAFFDDFARGAPARDLRPGQLALLVMIHQNPHLSQNQLSEGLRVDKSTLTISLNRLSRRGLLRRVQSTKDRRQNELELTTKGRGALNRMLRHIPRHERRMMKRLTASERRTLVVLLRKLL
jgi:DNA-binding MarR family transcriptional regulator